MRVHVAFTPAEAERAPTAIVVDVLRASSTIAQALASGYRRVLCCAEVEEAVELRARLGEAVLAGERKAVAIPGFDLGNSPREFTKPLGETLVLTTTNGTRAILSAAASAETVLVGSLLNLDAVAAAARGGGDVEIVCAGLQGRFTIDDAYCAGRIAELLGGEPSDAAEAAVRIARSFASGRGGAERVREPGARLAHGRHRLVRAGERRSTSSRGSRAWRARQRRSSRRRELRVQVEAGAPGSFPARLSSAQWAQMQPPSGRASQPGGSSPACASNLGEHERRSGRVDGAESA